VKYLQSSKCCPQCGLKIHETQPLLNLKADRVMQDVVFKLVPGLYESEFMFYLWINDYILYVCLNETCLEMFNFAIFLCLCQPTDIGNIISHHRLGQF